MEQKQKVFVYGTLRTYQSNHGYLSKAKQIASQSWTYGKLLDTGSGYPAMVVDLEARVFGELFEVTLEELKQLDWLEGYSEGQSDNLYERIIQPVHTDFGVCDAYVYIFRDGDAQGLPEIQCGDWTHYVNKMRSG